MNAVFMEMAQRLNRHYVNISRLKPDEKTEWARKVLRKAERQVFFDNHSALPDIAKGSEFRGLRLVRDPRDVIISAVRYHETTDATFANKPLGKYGNRSLKQALQGLPSVGEKIAFEIDHVANSNLQAMVDFDGKERYVTLHYEEFISDTRLSLSARLLTFLGLEDREVVEGLQAIWNNSLFGGGRGKRPDHVKDGSARQFERVYTPELLVRFDKKFGHIVDALGYRGDVRRSSGMTQLERAELSPMVQDLVIKLNQAATDDEVEAVLALESKPRNPAKRVGNGKIASHFIADAPPTTNAPQGEAIVGSSPLASLLPTDPALSVAGMEAVLAPKSKRPFLLTVDIEALPGRAHQEHVERLIWGRFSGSTQEAGIRRMLAGADSAGVPVTCYLDMAETRLYGEGILEAARFIHERGHDLQLHMHPELWSRRDWAELNFERPAMLQDLYSRDRAGAVLLEGLHEIAKVKARERIVSYRAGAFRIGPDVLEAMSELAIPISSNLSHRTYFNQRRIPPARAEERLFRWTNGIWELPVDQYVSGEEWRVLTLPLRTNKVRINSEEKIDAFVAALADTSDMRPVVFILHSWSLLQREKGARLMTGPSDRLIQEFDWLLQAAARHLDTIDVTTLAERLAAVDQAQQAAAPLDSSRTARA